MNANEEEMDNYQNMCYNIIMRIYLDNCTFNRPFDDQRNIIVQLETQAKLIIQQMIKNNELQLLWSDIIDYENNDNPFEERKERIAEWESIASENIEVNDEIIKKARIYMDLGLRQKDAVHISCAVLGKCEYFITVDKKILNKNISDINIIDPIDFLRRVQL